MRKIKEFRNAITRKWAQAFANVIIIMLEKSKTDEEFMFWMERGHMLDIYCVNRDIYLD